jgi:hydrogenase expression/formation protein HypC
MCLGIPGQVISIEDAARKLATVEVAGVKRQINLACVVDDAHPVERCVGEWVLIHVGFAMARISEQEARTTLQILEQLGSAQGELEAMSDPASAREA